MPVSAPADTTLSRRTVIRSIAAAGGGMILGFHLPGALAAVSPPESWPPLHGGAEINAWLAIDRDGRVTIRVPHSEQGQGALTSVAMLVAEELDVAWDTVRTVFADMHRHVNGGQEYIVTTTHGSQLVRLQHKHIMQAGASARERLRAAAASAWGIDRAEVVARQGVLSAARHAAPYARFATAAAALVLEQEPAIRTPDQWWLLGRETRRVDVPAKTDGSAGYAIDTRLDGMVYAAVKCCPVPWGRLVGYDFERIRHRPGVIAVVEFRAVPGKTGNSDLQDGVAVVADSWYRAKQALDELPIEWDPGASGSASTGTQGATARALLDTPGKLSAESGQDATAIIGAAKRSIRADYHRPYETHARMEPINATVSVTDARVDVWSPTQNPATPLLLVADQLGRDTREVFAHTVFIGGAFGGNGGGATAVTRQAAVISQQLKRPAKVIWSREEDIAQDKQRPPVYLRLAAALDGRGLPEALSSRAVWFTRDGVERVAGATADVGISNLPYRIPNRRHERHSVATHIPSATHRAPGTNQNGFIIEQFADEMAIAGGWDPLEWRIELTTGQEPWQRVLHKLREVAGFRTDLPRGRGMGVAVLEDHDSFCAVCATVEVSRSGKLRVEKLVIVANSGYVINPLNAAEQLEGAAVWELSHALHGGLELEQGRFTNTNFDSYALLRMDEAPRIETHFAPSQAGWWGGMGEPAGPPTPPAVANAIFFATGKRIRSTPIMKQDLSWS
jgi:isoquinoline 1-oxidoreductase beta subunit